MSITTAPAAQLALPAPKIIKESLEVAVYSTTPTMIQQYESLPTRDEPYCFGYPGGLLTQTFVGPDGRSQRSRAVLVRSRLHSRRELANRKEAKS